MFDFNEEMEKVIICDSCKKTMMNNEKVFVVNAFSEKELHYCTKCCEEVKTVKFHLED